MLTVETTRGGQVESCHVVRACAATVDGDVVGEASPGDAEWSTFLRSAAKPFQAAPAVAVGTIERLGLTDRHLAIGCASHDGSDAPVALVREVLAAAGLDDSALRTGDDGQGGPVHHQCSGNHALVLAWCVVEGWPVDGYLEGDHPAQRAMLDAMSVALGVPPEVAPDGCGMTAYRAPLRRFATAFARLGAGWSALPGLARCATAMRAHPYVVRERGQVDAELMAADPALVAKVGAEAALGVGSTSGVGVAVRIVDGGTRAWGPAGVAAARRWLSPDVGGEPVDRLAEPPVLDGHGRPVGVIRALWHDS